jgi:hypothetical protein
LGNCPVCKKRYSQEVEYCPDCRIGIIPDFRETIRETIKENAKTKTFVEVYRTQDVAIAGLIKEVLEDHEIICYLENYSLARIYPSLVSPIKVMVYKEHIEEAREVVNLFFEN